MRKSGWAAAGLGSLVLLLAACGGSSSSSTLASSPTNQSTSAGQSMSASASSGAATTPATGSKKKKDPPTWAPTPHNTAGPQPSSNMGSIPPPGTTVITVRISNLGYVLAKASGWVVYTYANDHKNGTPTCTGSCATVWAPVTGVPQVAPGVTLPGTLGLVTRTSGVKQITYNGYPLYVYKPGGPLVTTGNGSGGVWYVVKMSASNT